MGRRKWLLIVPLAAVYAFAFSYFYAVYFRIPALARSGSWLTRANISVEPRPTIEQALSAETVARIERETDAQQKVKWVKIRSAAENEVNAAHGEGFLIAILSLNIIWMPMIYRWRRKRGRLGRERMAGSERR